MHLGEWIMEHAQILGGVTGEVIRLQSFFFFKQDGRQSIYLWDSFCNI